MSDFEEALKRTVLGLGLAYELAKKDLIHEVTRASESVQRLTSGLATLDLDEGKESPVSAVYGLYLTVQNPTAWYPIAFFAVPSKGYPIRVAAQEFLITMEIQTSP